MILGLCNGNRLTHFIWGANERSNLQFDIELSARAPFRYLLLSLHIHDLTVGSELATNPIVWIPLDINARHNNRRSPSMITNRDMVVIGLKGVLRSTVHGSDTECVISPRIKIGVITNEHGHVHRHILPSMECVLTQKLIVPENRWIFRVLRKQIDNRVAYGRHRLPSLCSKRIQGGLPQVSPRFNLTEYLFKSRRIETRYIVESPRLDKKQQIKNKISNCGCGTGSLVVAGREDPKGDVLDGEMAVLWDGDVRHDGL
jgi:hypothetical protein